MKERINLKKLEPAIYQVMDLAEKTMAEFGLDMPLLELMKLRASQLNGCGYCVDLHAREALQAGVPERKVFAVAVWWETPFFTEMERCALKMTEEITLISRDGLTEETFQKALKYFNEKQLAQLIFTVAVTNTWNRLAVSSHMVIR